MYKRPALTWKYRHECSRTYNHSFFDVEVGSLCSTAGKDLPSKISFRNNSFKLHRLILDSMQLSLNHLGFPNPWLKEILI